jgi:hypothetical protein
MSCQYTVPELFLLAYGLSLSGALLALAYSPQVAAVPAFLAWLMLNRRNTE